MKPQHLLAVVSLLLSPVLSSAAGITYTAILDGPSESPANASPGTGTATVIYDPVAQTLYITATFSDLLGTTTAAHIHAPTPLPFEGVASVATTTPSFPGFPLSVNAGTFQPTTFNLLLPSSFRAGFITSEGGTVAGAEAALAAYLAEGRAYFNIHTTSFPGGEVRGFLRSVPDETSSAVLLVVGFAALFASRRFRLPTGATRALAS